jgi:hypothetical protein
VRVVHVPDQVGPNHLLVRIYWRVLVATDRAHARIAHPDIDRTQLGQRHIGKAPDIADVTDVRPYGGGLCADTSAARHHVVERIDVACGEDNLCSAPGEKLGGRLTYSARGASDDDA